MICCLIDSRRPLRNADVIVRCACREQEAIQAVYDAGVDLGRYGEIDHLAPAGSMAEFTDYVRRQSQEEAENAFAPLYDAARRRNLSVELHIVHGRKAVLDLLRQWRKRGSLTVFGEERFTRS